MFVVSQKKTPKTVFGCTRYTTTKTTMNTDIGLKSPMDLPNSSIFFSTLDERDEQIAEHSTSNLLNEDSSSSIFDMFCATPNTQTFHASLLDDIDLDLQCDEDSMDLCERKPLDESRVDNLTENQKSFNKESLFMEKELSFLQYVSDQSSGSHDKFSEISLWSKWSLPEISLNPVQPQKIIRCFVCHIQFSSQKSYLKHREDKHIKHELCPHECLLCCESFSTKRLLAKHKKVHHFKKQGKANVLSQCPQCAFLSRTKSLLKEHIRVKHEHKTFSCSQCSFSCVQERTWALHQLKHEGNPKFACDQCGKLFLAMSILKRHAHTHNKVRAHVCKVPECGRSFTIKSRLTDHIRTVHNHKTHNRRRKERFIAHQNSFNQGGKFKSQMRTICEDVSKVMQHEITSTDLVNTTSTNEVVVYDIVLSNENLKLLHSPDGEKNGSSACTTVFLSSEKESGLPDSKDKMGSVSTEELPVQQEMDEKCSHSVCQPSKDKPGMSKKFVCLWEGCNKSFRDRYNLRTHMCTHSGEMQRSCTLCRYRCIQKSAMDSHMKSHEMNFYMHAQ
ncbi:unnamed protein product [Lymnaea stagnalis]|uniref:C2H2-type domain-containing protein n=1 Tax=Lymnaea stagnalis TaxID=6523 RepID=A0AAV2HUS8_LYMST